MTTQPNMRYVQERDLLFDASGTIASGGTAQLVLPERRSTSMILIQNISSGTDVLWFAFGAARLTATISGGSVNSISVANAGFNFTIAPVIELLGGGHPYNTTQVGIGQTGFDAPIHPAQATAVMASAAPLPGLKISSVTITDPGTGYVAAPYAWVRNSELDMAGVSVPAANSAGCIGLQQYGILHINNVANPTDPIAVIGATTGDAFTVRWRP
jgi:hypothetical protein